jgi:hypothetical protein
MGIGIGKGGGWGNDVGQTYAVLNFCFISE